MQPPDAIREQLAAARRASVGFDDAWGRAMQDALAGLFGQELDEWRVALVSTEPDWRAAFERRPQRRAERSLMALAA
jgi:hypothetical protein